MSTTWNPFEQTRHRGLPVVGHAPWFHADTTSFLLNLFGTQGDVARFRLGGSEAFLLSHPDHVMRVLVDHTDAFGKGPLMQRPTPPTSPRSSGSWPGGFRSLPCLGPSTSSALGSLPFGAPDWLRTASTPGAAIRIRAQGPVAPDAQAEETTRHAGEHCRVRTATMSPHPDARRVDHRESVRCDPGSAHRAQAPPRPARREIGGSRRGRGRTGWPLHRDIWRSLRG